MNDIIVIVGPTGVGKTKLSIELAKRMDAEIINGDSVSIYKKLNIGSAKPSKEEMNDQKDCRNCIKDIESRNKSVIIVGGTGLYIKAALYDYRFSVENNYSSFDDLTNEEILDKIRNYDEKIDVHVNNRQRLVRLLNKFINNSEFSNDKDKLLYNIKVIGLTTDRNIIYDRINDRVDKMLENGLLSEVESLKDEYETSRILNSGIGYKEFKDYLFGDKKLDEVIHEIKKDSRHFAKRQYTFFNNQFDVKWFDVDFLNFNNTIDEVYEYIKE